LFRRRRHYLFLVLENNFILSTGLGPLSQLGMSCRPCIGLSTAPARYHGLANGAQHDAASPSQSFKPGIQYVSSTRSVLLNYMHHLNMVMSQIQWLQRRYKPALNPEPKRGPTSVLWTLSRRENEMALICLKDKRLVDMGGPTV
jgi:hypothetical protein